MSENITGKSTACPFCGCSPKLDDEDFCYPINHERTLWQAGCTSCTAHVIGYTREDAIHGWEMRANPELPFIYVEPFHLSIEEIISRVYNHHEKKLTPDDLRYGVKFLSNLGGSLAQMGQLFALSYGEVSRLQQQLHQLLAESGPKDE